MKRRILFVDDEPHILAGLRNCLRRQRGEWDMVFACGGSAAIVEMEKTPFDVMRSPRVRTLRERWSELVRRKLLSIDMGGPLETLAPRRGPRG